MNISALLLAVFLILVACHWFGVGVPSLVLAIAALAAGIAVLINGLPARGG